MKTCNAEFVARVARRMDAAVAKHVAAVRAAGSDPEALRVAWLGAEVDGLAILRLVRAQVG